MGILRSPEPGRSQSRRAASKLPPAALPRLEINASGTEVKAYEDALDAILCAWVATFALEGRATPFGDENSAIWIPTFHILGGH